MEHLDKDNVDNFTDDTFIQNVRDNSVDVEQLTETALLIILLRKSLAKLSDEEREIIDELFFNDSSMRKTAKKKGISLQALQRKLKKILGKLKKDLEDYNQ